MKKKINALLKKLKPEMREAVSPFLDEYMALTYGEKKEIKAYFGYTKSGTPETELLIEAFFKWKSDAQAEYSYKLKKRWLNACYPSDEPQKPKPFNDDEGEPYGFLVVNSPQYADFNRRIRDFIIQTEKVGREKFGDKDALWEAFFWEAPY